MNPLPPYTFPITSPNPFKSPFFSRVLTTISTLEFTDEKMSTSPLLTLQRVFVSETSVAVNVPIFLATCSPATSFMMATSNFCPFLIPFDAPRLIYTVRALSSLALSINTIFPTTGNTFSIILVMLNFTILHASAIASASPLMLLPLVVNINEVGDSCEFGLIIVIT